MPYRDPCPDITAMIVEEQTIRRRNRELFGVCCWRYRWFKIVDRVLHWGLVLVGHESTK